MSKKSGSLKLKMVLHESDDEVDKGDDCGISLEKLNIGPKKKLLVLSMGGLLLHKTHYPDNARIPKYGKCDWIVGNYLVYKRPFLDEFMKFCFEKFEVGIWLAVMGRNFNGILNVAMGTLRNRLLFIWALDNENNPLFLVELKKLWDKDDSSLPLPKGRYSSSNTLLIDYRPYKALLNPSNTAIFPHQYDAKAVIDDSLGPSGELRLFLEGLADAHDVPSYVKEHKIGQPEITSMHEDWEYTPRLWINIVTDHQLEGRTI